jgi:hypothetical protein
MLVSDQRTVFIRFALILILLGGMLGLSPVGSVRADTILVTNTQERKRPLRIQGPFSSTHADLQPGGTSQCFRLIRSLPGELDIVTTEMPVGGSLAIDRPA